MEEEEKELIQKFAAKSLEELEWSLQIMTKAVARNEQARDAAYEAFKESNRAWVNSMQVQVLISLELENRKKA